MKLYDLELSGNCYKVRLLAALAQIPLDIVPVDFLGGAHKRPPLTDLNPWGELPILVDGDRVLRDSQAILVYLAERAGKLLPSDAKGRSQVLQWLMLQMSGVGPMMGQSVVFQQYFPEKLPSVIERYSKECNRLMGVLDTRLGQVDFLAGDYSIADIATWPWVRLAPRIGIELDAFPNLKRWVEVIGARPAVTRGLARPPMMSDEDRIRAARKILVT